VAALNARAVEIRNERAALVAELLPLERSLPPDSEAVERKRSTRREAVELLNGSVAPLAEKLLEPPGRVEQLRKQIAIRDEALAIIDRQVPQLEAKEANERLERYTPDINAVMRQVVLALFAVDRGLRERDKVVRKIACSYPLPSEGWPLAGRLHNRGSQTYRVAEAAVRFGWITTREFAQELADADAAASEQTLAQAARDGRGAMR
jgi:hypothetical protein